MKLQYFLHASKSFSSGSESALRGRWRKNIAGR